MTVLKLKELKKGIYAVLKGKKMPKSVDGKVKEVVPVSIADFASFGDGNVLARSPSESATFMYNNGFFVFDDGSHTAHFPAAMSPACADVKAYQKDALLVLGMDSDRLIQSQRTLDLFSALESITAENLSNMRSVEDFVQQYERYSDDPREWKKVIKEGAKKFGQSKDDLAKILTGYPKDSYGASIMSGTKTDLVIAGNLTEAELTSMLNDLSSLDELKKVRLNCNYPINGKLKSAPMLLLSEYFARDRDCVDVETTQEFYDMNVRDSGLRALIRKAQFEPQIELAMSPMTAEVRDSTMVLAPGKDVLYAQAVQPIGNDGAHKAYEFRNGIDITKSDDQGQYILGTAVFQKTVDLKSDFRTPPAIHSLDWQSGDAQRTFKKHFEKDVQEHASQLSKDYEVTGVALSPIAIRTHLIDMLFMMGQDSVGQYAVAATYVGNPKR